MSEVAAYFLDGRSSRRRAVRIHLTPPDNVRITGPDVERSYRLCDIRISPRIGNTPRAIYLPDDSKCEVADNDAIDEFLSSGGKTSLQGFVYLLESRLKYAAAALAVTCIVIWGFIVYGVPELARRTAFALPSSVNASLGADGLELLDKVLLEPSELDREIRERYRAKFSHMALGSKGVSGLRLEFRKSAALGPNAFALPSGIIVFTDELIKLAEDDNEVIAVMAHEIGHVAGRHSLRMLLQDSAVALLISTISGDITSITALSATIPTILVAAKYSKEFETEADTYAYNFLKEMKIPTVHFANILERMTEASGVADKHDFLSSHPAPYDRVKRFKGP